MWRCVVEWVVPSVLKDRSVFAFKGQTVQKKLIPSHSSSTESSTAWLWKPQISYLSLNFFIFVYLLLFSCPFCLCVIEQGAQIPGTRLLWQLNFMRWCLIFMGSQYETCLMSCFWCLGVLGGSWIFGMHPWERYLNFPIKKLSVKLFKIWKNVFVTIKVLVCSRKNIVLR
jgi:hypothetical protein